MAAQPGIGRATVGGEGGARQQDREEGVAKQRGAHEGGQGLHEGGGAGTRPTVVSLLHSLHTTSVSITKILVQTY